MAIPESEHLFRSVFEYAAIGMALVNPEGRWLEVNSSLCSLVGYSKEELLQKTFQDITYPDDLDADIVQARQVLNGEIDTYQLEKRYFNKQGHIVWVLLSASLMRDQAGEPTYFITQIQDITARKKSEAARRETSTLQRAILDGANYFIVSTDSHGLIRTFNRAAERNLGYQAREVIGKTTPLIFHDQAELIARAQGLTEELGKPIKPDFEVLVTPLRTGEPNIEWTLVRKDGSRFLAQLSVSFLLDEKGNVEGFIAVGHDITKQKDAEARLVESEERWQLVLRGNNDGVWDWNIRTNQVYLSPRWKEMLGFADNEIGDQFSEWERRVHPDDIGWVTLAISDHFERKTPYHVVEYRMLCKDGSYKWIESRGQAMWDDSGHPVRMVGSHTDITERKNAENEILRVNEELRQALAEVKVLQGILPICASCKNVRNDQGYWQQIESYIKDHSELRFSHGICPGCAEKLYPEIYGKILP